MLKLNARELRTSSPDHSDTKSLKRNPITIVLDNVLDTYNVGSIFRLADAVAAEKVYLCGETLSPPNSRIKKASVNTWQWVNWEHVDNAVVAINLFRSNYIVGKVFAVEQDIQSTPFDTVKYSLPIAIVVGNETHGISQEVLEKVDKIVEIPMWGVNKSLNVMVSLGIILYQVMKKHE